MDDAESREQRQTLIPATPDSKALSLEIMGIAYRAPSPTEELQPAMLPEPTTSRATTSAARLEQIEVDVSEPRTPERSCLPHPWHGLATPGSPQNFGDCSAGGENDTDLRRREDSKDNDTDETITADAALVQQESSHIFPPNSEDDESGLHQDAHIWPLRDGPRRSSRVQQKSDMKGVAKLEVEQKPLRSKAIAASPGATSPEAVQTLPTQELIPSPPASIFSKEASVPISFELDSDVLSIDWQLKWPPGGSTHPSYPYPGPDPRLLFDPHIIPVVDDIPRIQDVPQLILPIRWKHVTWSGLLPIAFDPYNQAFKLTPVGPLPLTHEELQQNGLSKFVPGGVCHAEAGTLPDISHLGDGSTGDDLDLDGASWTLPFMDLSTLFPSNHVDLVRTVPEDEQTVHEDTTMSREAFDCPDQVYDLEDGWRWLIEKEQNPTRQFESSSVKRWYGTGAERSSRKFKLPIAEIMSYAIKDDFAQDDTFSINQDSRPTRGLNMFCAFRSVATAMTVQISLLADTEITVIELLTYFPQHIQWHHAAERLGLAGITPQYIFKIINFTRHLSGEATMRRSLVASNIATAKKRLPQLTSTLSDKSIVQNLEQVSTTIYSAEGWELGGNYDVHDYPILALTHGVHHLPVGNDAGPLTALIHWCRANQRYKALLSDVPALLKEANISFLIEPGESGCPDKEVLGRFNEKLKADHRRVVRSLEDLELSKQDSLAEEGVPRKKRKIA